MSDNEGLPGAPLPPPTSLGLGERLRSARKARALSMAQVAEALRLEEASVVALEEGRFEAMGAPVFVRGHLKRYAALVGLNVEVVLEAYRAAAPGSDAPPMIARPRAQADFGRIGPWAWWLLAAVIIIAAILALGGGEEETLPSSLQTLPEMGAPQPEPVPQLPAPADAPVQAPAAAPQPVAPAPGN